MNMIATVLRVDPQSLLVRDEDTGEEVVVFYRDAGNFAVDDIVKITHNGQMTLSIPPQVTATLITRLSPSVPAPSVPGEMRVVIIQKGRNFLMVRNLQNRQTVRVEYPYAHHFCVRQQVVVRYDSISLTNPPRVNATDIIPLCLPLNLPINLPIGIQGF